MVIEKINISRLLPPSEKERRAWRAKLARREARKTEVFQKIVSLYEQGYSHKEIERECESNSKYLQYRIDREEINNTIQAHSAGYSDVSSYRNRNSYQERPYSPVEDFKISGGCKEDNLVDANERYQSEVTHSPMEILSIQDSKRVLESYLNHLPLRQRDTIFRRFYQGQTLEQVADAYCCSTESARRTEKKALQALKKRIVSMHKRELSDFADLLGRL